MPARRGRFQYLSPGGEVLQQGGCEVRFDDAIFSLAPDDGPPLVFDLGDVDALVAADFTVRATLFTGNALLLQQFGKATQDLVRELLEAWRERSIRCLLLADLEQVFRVDGRFELESGAPGAVAGAVAGAAELRLYRSNLAVLPLESAPFQWRLADVTSHGFDAQRYELVLRRDGDVLRLGRLGRQTDPFVRAVRESLQALAVEGARALGAILPFLDANRLQAAHRLLPEGHSARVSELSAVDSRIAQVLAANAVDASLAPYYEALLERCVREQVQVGYKLIRPEDEDGAVGDDASAPGADPPSADAGASDDGPAADATGAAPGAPDADAAGPPALYWFFFPIAASGGALPDVVAWEASSRAGRATYFFRLAAPGEDPPADADGVARAVARITRVLGLVNFRRRPIYLSDADLESKPEWRRYAIAARRIPELRAVRSAFLGRASHVSLSAWRGQVDAVLVRARSGR
ncbi:MAG: hypothetical protein U1E86_20890 [Burkholderiaceae bacterium]